ncbi:MAG TPA: hypothetical protein PLP17_11490, partial [Oligoflexia bacterium]|nr:hypothetical protein [Oligoflexia bacterium]
CVGAGFAGECVMFMPLEQTGLNVDRDELESLVIESDGHRAHAIYLSRGKPWIEGFAFGTGGVCAERAAGEQLGAYMPTLIAVRNGARLGLGDRLRNVNEAHFVFQRDRLSTDARGFLRYRAEGLRGTSDFAQYLVPGDQIVDLEGRFIGLAPEENMVVPIRSLSGWRKTGLTHVSAKNALAALGLPKE